MVELREPCYDPRVAITKWDPLRDLLALHEHIGQLVGTDAPGWQPPVDLVEYPDRFLLTAELPGLAREEIEIHAEEQRVVVRGERVSCQVPCEHYLRVERGHGRFQRTFLLPGPVAVHSVSATLQDGILTITLMKAGEHAPRTVHVT